MSSTQTLQADGAIHAPRLVQRGASLALTGAWTARGLGAPGHWQALQTQLAAIKVGTQSSFTWDLRELTGLDHLGAQLLWRTWGQRWPENLAALPAQRALLDRVAQFQSPPLATGAWSARQFYLGLGEALLKRLAHVRDFVRLLGQLFLDTLQLLAAPQKGPWRDVSGHLYQTGATALPITALVGALIGVVLAYLTAQQLQKFGADAFIVDIMGVSVIRELGPMLAAILVAGRSGSAMTAQIGVMRVTEELDAMRVLGIAPGYRLVLPRVLALSLAMPLIATWTMLMALGGGMLAADISLGVSPQFFMAELPKAVQQANLWLALSKSAVFGAVIALIACHWGLRIKPNTQSLGKGVTASVVTAITAVILINAVFAVVFKDVGI
jgi:phospholipid/cholesterol/gamma-HCH transport system permease protein